MDKASGEEKEKMLKNIKGHFDRDLQEKHDSINGLPKWKHDLGPGKDVEIWDVPFIRDDFEEENDTESENDSEEDAEEQMAAMMN